MKMHKDQAIYTGLWFALMAMLCLTMSCRDPYKPFWIGANTAAKMRNDTDKAVAKSFEDKKETCKKQTLNDTDYVKCVETSKEYKLLFGWTKFVWPTVTASLKALQSALIMSKAIKDDSDAAKKQWLAHLKKAVCTVAVVVMEFKDLFPDSAKTILGYVETVKMFTCEAK